MFWWLIASLYVVGWMISFRTVFLKERDSRQRWIAERRRDHLPLNVFTIKNQVFRDNLKSVELAFAWPLFILFLISRFLMFPRGIRTPFDREQELEREKAELEKAVRVLEEEKAKELTRARGIIQQ